MQAKNETAEKMLAPETGDMSAADFRRAGYEIVDWIADYFQNIESFPVLSQNEPNDLKNALPKSAPENGEDFAEVLKDVDRLILPAVTHWNHPNFHGLFATATSSVGVFGEMFTAAFDMKAMLWRTSPASTELEETVLDWLRQMMNLPEDFRGIIYDTASVSTLHAIAVARERLNLRIREDGMSGRTDLPLLRVYCSEQVHSSIDKAVIMLGLGQKSLVKIPTNNRFEMDTEKLREAIQDDKTQGHLPMCVVPTIGTTSSSSVDDVERIADICERNDLWLHVDTAYAGATAIVPEFQKFFAGMERADSIVTNPHKWLFTPFDLSVLFVKDLDLLKKTFALVPEYLKTNETVNNQMDYGIQLGRRFRSLKFWFILRYFGQQGLIDRIREHCSLARLFASWVERSENFEMLAPVPFALVCFRAAPEGMAESEIEKLNERIMNDINASGEAYLSHTKLDGKYTLRLSVGSIRVEERHLRKVWDLLIEKLKMKFVKESIIRAAPERVFAFHQLPDAFERLIPPWETVKILKRADISEIGSETIIKSKVFGFFPVKWVARHTKYEPPEMFEDVQISGPFASWRHQHIVLPHASGAILKDEIEYEPPMSFVGRSIAPFFVESKLEKMFAYRHEVTRKWCEEQGK